MNKRPNPELIDSDKPEWTEEMFTQGKRISDLPNSLQSKLDTWAAKGTAKGARHHPAIS